MFENAEYADKVWTRWRREYLTSLTPWVTKGRGGQQPQVGDVVLVGEPVPRGLWPLARVLEIIRGRDGQVVAAKVKIRKTVSRRQISQLYLIERALTKEPTEEECPAADPAATRKLEETHTLPSSAVARERLEEVHAPPHQKRISSVRAPEPQGTGACYTRSGRLSRPVTRFNMSD